MDWQQRMMAAIAYLEGCLTGEPDMEKAAREANCSPFHFMRMFEVITGIGPAEYVRRRRLSLAAAELATGDARILDLAVKYGYNSSDSFSRAFKREFDCLPSEARVSGATLHCYPPLSFTIALIGDKAMEYRIEKRPACAFTGIAIRANSKYGTNFKDVPAFWDNAMADGNCDKFWKKARGSKLGVVGVCFDFNMKTEDFSYAIAIEKPADREGLPEGCVDIEVPEATWAMFTSRGPLKDNFQNMIRRIYSEWFPASGREHAGTVEIEYYGTNPDPAASDYWCEYWVPLK
mgnify:FL=1